MGIFGALLPIAAKAVGSLFGGKKDKEAEKESKSEESKSDDVAKVEGSNSIDMETLTNIVTQVASAFKKDDTPKPEEEQAMPPRQVAALPPLAPPTPLAALPGLGTTGSAFPGSLTSLPPSLPMNTRLQQAPVATPMARPLNNASTPPPSQGSRMDQVLAMAKPPVYGRMAGF